MGIGLILSVDTGSFPVRHICSVVKSVWHPKQATTDPQLISPHCPLSMTELPKGFWLVLAYLVGVVMGVIGVNLLSHKPSHSRRQPVEHCILLDTAPDYRDVQCLSGTWRYIGDTLRIRLHT